MKVNFDDLFEEQDGALVSKMVLHLQGVVIQPGEVKQESFFGVPLSDYKGKDLEVVPHESYYEVVGLAKD